MENREPFDIALLLATMCATNELHVRDTAELKRALAAWTYKLTPEEVTLLEYVSRGDTNDEIAQHLHLSDIKSVKERLTTLFRKIGAQSRIQAAAFAGRVGLVNNQ